MNRSARTPLVAVLAVVTLAYLPTLVAPFCSYDDFWEVHRATFRDAADPARVFTTSHFDGARYRPLNRALTLVFTKAGGGGAALFRLRNLASHLGCVALLYALSLALFASPAAAAWGALLFGLHPLANMTIVGAVVTNAVGHALLLGALLLFLSALRSPRGGIWLVLLSLAAAGLGILTYDGEVAYFPLALLLVLVERAASGRWARAAILATWAAGSAALLAGVLALRWAFVPAGKLASSFPTPAIFLKGALTFGGALFLPVDSVLLAALLGTPFPPELLTAGAARRGLALALLGVAAVAALALAAVAAARLTREERRAAAPGAAFLAIGVLVLLGPQLVLTKHASETYVYLPAGFVALLAGFLLAAAGRTAPRAALAVGLALALLAGAATLVRNVAVLRCGRAAQRLVAGLLVGGGSAPSVLVANAAGEERSHRYGFYGFRGTDTVGDGGLADSTLTCALELARRRPGAAVSLLDASDLARAACAPAAPRPPAFWVRADGSVTACACDARETKENR